MARFEGRRLSPARPAIQNEGLPDPAVVALPLDRSMNTYPRYVL